MEICAVGNLTLAKWECWWHSEQTRDWTEEVPKNIPAKFQVVTLCLAVVQTFSVLCRAKMCKKFHRNCSDVACTELRTSSVTPGTTCSGKISLFVEKISMQTYVAMKEAYSEQTLARSTIFHRHQQFTHGRASASPKPKSGRLVAAFTKTTVNTIGTSLRMMIFLLQRQIALVSISQTTMKRIILSLFFPVISIGVYAYAFICNIRFYVQRSYGHFICIIRLIFSQVM